MVCAAPIVEHDSSLKDVLVYTCILLKLHRCVSLYIFHCIYGYVKFADLHPVMSFMHCIVIF